MQALRCTFFVMVVYFILDICYSIVKCAKRVWSVGCKQVVVKFTWINCGRSLRQSPQEFAKEKRHMKEQHKRGAWCEIHSTPKPQASVGTVKRCETRCETEWYENIKNDMVSYQSFACLKQNKRLVTADSTVEQLHILPKLGSTGVEQLLEEKAKDRFLFSTLAMFFEADKYAMLCL